MGDLEFRVWGQGFETQGSGLRVEGCRSTKAAIVRKTSANFKLPSYTL